MHYENLPPQHQTFVDAFIIHNDASKAAIAAGYSESRAKQTGYEILHREDVQLAIKERRKPLEEAAFATLKELHQKALDVANMALGSYLSKQYEKKDIPIIVKSLDKAWPKDGAGQEEEPPGFIINADNQPPP